MDHLMGQITIIDTLGIFLPGAIFIVAINFYGIWDVAAPWKALLGEGDVPMLVYFVGLSYLCGSVIHEISLWMERLLMKIPHVGSNLHESHWKDPEVCGAYEKVLKGTPPVEGPNLSGKNLQTKQLAAGREIFRTVRQRSQPKQMILFDATYTMSRALVLTLFCVAVMAIATQWSSWQTTLPTVAVCAVCIVIFFRRWLRYEKRCIEEAYRIFLTYPQQPAKAEEPVSVVTGQGMEQ